jgi:cytochrome P450
MQLGGMLGLSVKLPPGSLGPSGVARLGDEDFYLRKFSRHGPLFKVLWNRHLAVCVVGFRRAKRLLALHAHALAPIHIDIRSFVPHGFLRAMAPEPHARYRALFLNALRMESTMAWESEIRTAIRGALHSLVEATNGSPARAESLIPSLDEIATRSLLIPLFGLTPTDARFRALEEGYRRLGPTGFVYPIGPAQVDAFGELRVLVWQIVEAFKADPPTSNAQGLLARLLAPQDGSVVDETVIGNLIYMIEVGRYDVRSLLRWILKYLSDHPAIVADLRAKPANTDDFTELAEACVLETLRLDQAEAMNREVREEFVFEGYRVPKGSAVRLLMRETHKNPDVFREPEGYRPCRFVGKTYSADDYAPFGVGEHRCIVGPMVVHVCTMFVEELIAGFTWTVVGDGPRFRGRHHWEPSPSFSIALRSRSGAPAAV